MAFISGRQSDLSRDLLDQLSRYRYQVFVETLGWQLQAPDGMELDQFDRRDTVYVISRDERLAINGCARLLRTDHPYLLGEVFPELLNGETPPCSSEVWELSRFAAVDFNCKKAGSSPCMSSEHAIGLMEEALRCASVRGANALITVSPLGVERLLRNAGIRWSRAGRPMRIDGHQLVACWLEVANSNEVQCIAEEIRHPPAGRFSGIEYGVRRFWQSLVNPWIGLSGGARTGLRNSPK